MNSVIKKCDCNIRNSNGTCPTHSKIKMGIMLKSGCDDLKKAGPNGKKVNPYWYNYMKNNRQQEEKIIEGMFRRFQNDVLFRYTNVLLFFDNATNQQIAKISIT